MNPEKTPAKICRLCAETSLPDHRAYTVLTEVLNAVALDDSLRTSIIPDDMMRTTSRDWRNIQRQHVPVKFKGYEPAEMVRSKLEMFVRDGFRVSEVNMSSGRRGPPLLGHVRIGDEGMKMLSAVLMKCPLDTLDISGAGLSDRGAIPLALVARWSPLLTKLVLDYNELGDPGATTLGNALRHCPSLEILSVNHINMEPEGFFAITDALVDCSRAQHASVFKSLSANNNYIVGGMEEDTDDRNYELKEPFYSALYNLTDQCSNLQVLDLGGNSIINLWEITQALRHATQLTSLHLDNNEFDFDGQDPRHLEKFMCALETHPSLTELDLSLNEIWGPVYNRLAQVLPRCTTLAVLDLSDTTLTDGEAGTMSDAVAQSPHLTSLNLRWNHMSVDGMNALRQAWLNDDDGLDLRNQSPPDDSDNSDA